MLTMQLFDNNRKIAYKCFVLCVPLMNNCSYSYKNVTILTVHLNNVTIKHLNLCCFYKNKYNKLLCCRNNTNKAIKHSCWK